MDRHFVTTEPGIAAFLLARGHPIVHLNRPPSDWRLHFYFERAAESVAAEYDLNGTVLARALVIAMADVRGMIRRHPR
jgi:hypothetical protein